MTIAAGQKMYADDILNLTFFPKGAILTFSTAAWGATSAEFKNIWKICNTANHQADPNVPDLTNRFLRGGASSDFTTGGGADSQSVTLTTTHLPSHAHGTENLSLTGLSTSNLRVDPDEGHSHTLSGGVSADGSHDHSFSDGKTAEEGDHSHTVTVHDSNHNNTPSSVDYSSDEYGRYDSKTYTTSPAGKHTHTVSGTISTVGTHVHDFSSTSIAVLGGVHKHTISGSLDGSISGSVDNAGDGQAFSVNTVPAYYTVIYIIKVA